MNDILKFFLIILSFTNIAFSQCEISETTLDDGKRVISMTEKFYQNDDLENGAKTFYVSANNFILEEGKSIFDLAVTYISIKTTYWIVPNTLKIGLINGEKIVLKANGKSSQTLNRIKPVPNTAKGIECYFQIDYNDLLKVLDSDSISYLKIEDYKTGEEFDITPFYKGQLNDLMKCVLKL